MISINGLLKTFLVLIFLINFLYKGSFASAVKESKVSLADSVGIIKDSIYTNVDILPSFKGGMEDMYKFFSKRLKYPTYAKDYGIQGRIMVRFIVEKDGSLTNLEAAKGVGFDLNKEAIRVVKLSPKWNPAMVNGEPVRSHYQVPVIFHLEMNSVLTLVDDRVIPSIAILRINPEIIDDVEVLSSKAAMDQFGDKGANGAILITLKRKKQ